MVYFSIRIPTTLFARTRQHRGRHLVVHPLGDGGLHSEPPHYFGSFVGYRSIDENNAWLCFFCCFWLSANIQSLPWLSGQLSLFRSLALAGVGPTIRQAASDSAKAEPFLVNEYILVRGATQFDASLFGATKQMIALYDFEHKTDRSKHLPRVSPGFREALQIYKYRLFHLALFCFTGFVFDICLY